MTTTSQDIDLTTLDLGEAKVLAATAGSRVFGNVVIAWNPSTTEASVEVTVTMGGTPIGMKTLTPTDNQMTFSGESGQDWAKGGLYASFSASGKNGQINGSLEWQAQGIKGNFSGFIGAW